MASLHPAIHNAQNKSTYRRYEEEINLDGINLPLHLNSHSFDKIEKQNPHLSLNIYKYEKTSKKGGKNGSRQNIIVYPFRVSPRRSTGTYKEVNLLILNDENDNDNFHFVSIKSLSKLVTAAYTKHHGKAYTCRFCLQCFTKPTLLDKHVELCQDQKPQRTSFPKDDQSSMRFKNYDKMLPVPYWISADFETRPEKNQNLKKPQIPLKNHHLPGKFPWIRFENEQEHVQSCNVCNIGKPCTKISESSEIIQHLEAFSWAYQVSGPSHDTSPIPIRIDQTEDCQNNFLESLKNDCFTLNERLKQNVAMNLSEEEESEFQAATTCFICKNEFTKNLKKNRDHDHLSGKFRGAACTRCNLAWRYKNPISVLMHNSSSFDTHLVFQAIAKDSTHVKQVKNIIANNIEKYISFDIVWRCQHCIENGENEVIDPEDDEDEDETGYFDISDSNESECFCKQIRKCRFKDSFKFLSSSLDTLCSNLKSKCRKINCSKCTETTSCENCEGKEHSKDVFKETFKYVSETFHPDKFELASRKAIYPYDYIDSYEKLLEKKLPEKHCFFNSLFNESLSDEDYSYAEDLWKELKFETVGDMARHYQIMGKKK